MTIRPNARKYDWERWTSSQAWRVQWLVDFECSPQSFQTQIYAEAARRELKVSTTVVEGLLKEIGFTTTFVFFQFYERYSPWKPNLESLPAVRMLRK